MKRVQHLDPDVRDERHELLRLFVELSKFDPLVVDRVPLALLGDPAARVRTLANMDALGKAWCERNAGAIVACLGDTSKDVRCLALRLVAQLGASTIEAHAPALCERLASDRDRRCRQASSHALLKISNGTSSLTLKEHIMTCLDDDLERLRANSEANSFVGLLATLPQARAR